MSIPDMKVRVTADTSDLESGLSAAAKAGAAFGATISGLAAATAAAVKSIVNMADETTKLAQKTGIAMRELQELAHVANLSGVSVGELQTAVGRLTRGMSDFARGGTSESARALKALGIEIKNTDGTLKSSSQVLEQVAEKFSGYRDGAEKTALAIAIFGRAGANMIPMLNGGKAAIIEARKELEQFGAVASDSLGRDSERLNDNLSRLGTFLQGIGVQIAERVVPALANASDALVQWLRESGAAVAVGNALGAMFQNLEAIVTVAAAALLALFGPALVASIIAITKLIGVGLVAAFGTLAAVIAANPLAAAFVAIAAAAHAMGVDVINVIKTVVNTIIGSFRAAATDVQFVWQNMGNVIGAAMIGIVNAVIRAINGMVNAAKAGVNILIAAINKIPGIKVDPLDTSGRAVEEMANGYAEAIGPALADRNRKIGEAMGKDYIGSFVQSIKSMAGTAAAAVTAATGTAPGVPKTGKAGKTGSEEESDEEENRRLRERLERRLEVIRQSVLKEEELLIHKYNKAQELAKQAFDLDMASTTLTEEQKLAKAAEYHKLREDLERTHQEKLMQIRAAADARSLNNLATFFSGAQALAQSNGNKSFKTAKAFAIGSALLSTAAAAIQAMADPTAITPWQKFANYAMVLGRGMSAVASIRSMQPSGGGGGGGGGGGAATAAASQPSGGSSNGSGAMGNAVYINLQGQSFGRDQVRSLIEQIAAYQKDGGQVVFA